MLYVGQVVSASQVDSPIGVWAFAACGTAKAKPLNARVRKYALICITCPSLRKIDWYAPQASGLRSIQRFFNTSIAASVIASVAVEITASASGAQKGLCSDGSFKVSPLTASHLACGTPPTQKIVLCLVLSASQ